MRRELRGCCVRAAGDVRGPRSCRGDNPGGRRGRGAELRLRDGRGGAGCGPAEKVSVPLPPGLTPSPRCRDHWQGVCRRGGRLGVRPHSLAIRGSGLDHSAPRSPPCPGPPSGDCHSPVFSAKQIVCAEALAGQRTAGERLAGTCCWAARSGQARRPPRRADGSWEPRFSKRSFILQGYWGVAGGDEAASGGLLFASDSVKIAPTNRSSLQRLLFLKNDIVQLHHILYVIQKQLLVAD